MFRPITIAGTALALATLAACGESVSSRLVAPDASANYGGTDKVTICHAAGLAGTTHYVTLTLSVNGAAAHFRNNGTPQAGHELDYMGACRTPPVWTVVKTLVNALTESNGQMVAVGSNPVVIPSGETRWLVFQITVTGTGTATLTDLMSTVCSGLPAGFRCASADLFGLPGFPMSDFTWPTLTGDATFTFMLDITNTGVCGVTGTVTNVARLTPTGQTPQTSQVSVRIEAPACTDP